MSCLKIPVGKFSFFGDNWNSKFHSLLNQCNLVEEYPPRVLPNCYGVNETCGYVLQVDLSNVALNTLHLTVLEEINENESSSSQINVAALYIQTLLFSNPLWDLGVQHHILKKNEDKLYTNQSKVRQYTSKCICPCSHIFGNRHTENHFDLLPKFTPCVIDIFLDTTSFVQHLWHSQRDYYHCIIRRMVQSTYSTLISKIKIPIEKDGNPTDGKSFGCIHPGKVSLLSYVKLISHYDTFNFK